ncbi:MAG: hypothetical protein ACLRG1_08040 [Streptococcus salivarius]
MKRRGYTEEKYTFKYIEGYDAKTPTQVLSKFLKVRRNMIGKIQDYKLKDVKVKGNDATVTLLRVLLVPMELQLLFVLSL